MAKMLELKYGLKNINRNDISLNVLGVNHFTWITQANYKTIDLMPIFGEFAEKYADDGFALNDSDKDKNNYFRNMNKVCFDMFRRYRAIPCAGDRHIAEFMPPRYLKTPETVEKWGFALTPVSWRKDALAKKIEKSSRIVSGQEKFHIGKSGEEGTEQIKALLGLSELVTNVNIPNIGQAEGLPIGAIVETNAVFGKNAVRPVFSGKLPDTVNTIVGKHAINQQLLIEAGVKKDVEFAFNVFLNDNLMTLDIKDAEKLFGEMINNTQKYLEGWDIK
jgi:alpha-galactosidase